MESPGLYQIVCLKKGRLVPLKRTLISHHLPHIWGPAGWKTPEVWRDDSAEFHHNSLTLRLHLLKLTFGRPRLIEAGVSVERGFLEETHFAPMTELRAGHGRVRRD